MYSFERSSFKINLTPNKQLIYDGLTGILNSDRRFVTTLFSFHTPSFTDGSSCQLVSSVCTLRQDAIPQRLLLPQCHPYVKFYFRLHRHGPSLQTPPKEVPGGLVHYIHSFCVLFCLGLVICAGLPLY